MLDRLFILLQHILPQHCLSRLTGRLAECRTPWLKNTLIKAFANHFIVNMQEAERESFQDYENFNDFFTRALKPDARTVCAEPHSIVSPADGAVSEIGDIELGSILQAKGQSYSLINLLGGDPGLCNQLMGGKFATIYLSPRDYHRVHMPCAGKLVRTTYVPGALFSVNQTTANHVPGLFARNERLVCEFEGEQGPFVLILVGAMIVAGIETVWAGEVAPVKPRLSKQDFLQQEEILLQKGDEMGRFKLGSTAIILFPENTVEWHENLNNGSALQMGQAIGRFKN